jgi:hypothetical protein
VEFAPQGCFQNFFIFLFLIFFQILLSSSKYWLTKIPHHEWKQNLIEKLEVDAKHISQSAVFFLVLSNSFWY